MSAVLVNLAVIPSLARHGETAPAPTSRRVGQGDFLDLLGFQTYDYLGIGECEGDFSTPYRLGSTSDWLEDYHNRLDFCRVAIEITDGNRRHFYQDLAANSRECIRALGRHPWRT